jgi:hypothetical protein
MNFDFEDKNKSLKSYLKGIFLYTIGIICVFGFEPWAVDILHIKSRSIYENILGWVIPFLIYGGLMHLMGEIKRKNYRLIEIIGTIIGFVIILVLKNLGGSS